LPAASPRANGFAGKLAAPLHGVAFAFRTDAFSLSRSTMSAAFTEDQARAYIHKLLAAMSQAGGSDLFIAADFPPSMKSQGAMKPLTTQKLTADVARMLAQALMNETQRAEFAKEMECNFAISLPGVSRFRVNVFVQQRSVGMVIRTIA
jgi:twitching motility protein PilU